MFKCHKELAAARSNVPVQPQLGAPAISWALAVSTAVIHALNSRQVNVLRLREQESITAQSAL